MTLVFKTILAAALVSTLLGASQPMGTPAFADDVMVQLAQDSSQSAIQPSEAASIAKNAYPNAKVLNVKLLPNGVYAVTLKIGGSVTRVMVDATTGALG